MYKGRKIEERKVLLEKYFRAKKRRPIGMERENDVFSMNDEERNSTDKGINEAEDIACFGHNEESSFTATDIIYSENGIYFKLNYKEETFSVYVPGQGNNNILNALAAIAAVSEIEIDRGQASQDLLDFYKIDEQVEFQRGIEGCIVIDDTLNSSPYSMEVALEVMKNISNKGNKIIIFGIIPIIGSEKYKKEQYEKISKKLFEVKANTIIAVGKEAEKITERLMDLGIDQSKIFYSNNGIEIYRIISGFVNEDTSILLKITSNQMQNPSFLELKNKLILEYE